MNVRASGRLRCPLVSLFLLLVAAGAISPGAAASVRPTQQLVTLLRSHNVRAAPKAGSPLMEILPARTPITGIRTVLPVLAQHRRWLKVRLPGRPNGHTGWISQSATVRSATTWHLVVNPSRRRVIVYRAGRYVRMFKAVVGKRSTPTPEGEFFVEEAIALRSFDVGAPYALALSARSNVLQEFDGGPGQIALHGLANVGGVPGTAVSHGCVRLDNAVMRWLVARIGPGVPVTVRD